MRHRFLLFALGYLLNPPTMNAQSAEFVPNYDEAKVPTYTLPALLTMPDGQTVTSVQQWQTTQRPQLLNLFKKHVYGRLPDRTAPPRALLLERTQDALAGKAIRQQVRLFLTNADASPYIDVLLYLPKTNRPVPVFVGYNFEGNYTTTPETAVRLTTNWVHNTQDGKVAQNRATEANRGTDASSWPYEQLIASGYGVATAYYGDIEPDHTNGWKTGIRSTLATQLQLKPDQWSAIGAWAWGLSRIADYLQTDNRVDPKRMIAIGHSRLGKTALWAGANDERFAMVVSNESGEGGAALTRRVYGETLGRITSQFPHWFLPTYAHYADRLNELPTDQHMLLAMIAPRPLYVASAEKDRWADPRGEFLGAVAAEPAWQLYGKTGLGTTTYPAVDTPIGQTVGYHVRTGSHDITAYDWQQYIRFADRLLN